MSKQKRLPLIRTTVVAALCLARVAQAAPLAVCTLSFHSADEVDVFRAHLPPEDFEVIDLSPPALSEASPAIADPSWLQERCRPDLKCDVLVISAEFAGRFFGRRGVSLGLQDMEEASCQARCDALFHAPSEVFLLACNTLATKDQDNRTPQEYLQVLLDHGFDRTSAERVVALRYGPLGPSFREALRRVFMNVPRIYGFSSVAPVGNLSAPLLEKYFRTVGNYRQHLERAQRETTPNRALLAAFAGSDLVQVPGLTAGEQAAADRARICRLYDEQVSVAGRLRVVQAVMARPDFLAFLPAIEVFVSRHPGEQLQEGEERELFADIQRRESAKAQVLALVRQLDVSALQLELADLAVHLGWMSRDEFRTLAIGGAQRLLAQHLTAEGADIMCEITRHEPLHDVFSAGAFAPELFTRAEGIRVVDCLGPVDETVTPRLLPALDSPDLLTRLWAAFALSHRLPLDDDALLALSRHLDDPSADVRARLEWIFRAQRPRDREVRSAVRERSPGFAHDLGWR